MFQRILVPLDGSLRAERAIPVAARLASASHSSLLLVRVIDVFLDFSWQMAGVPPDLTGALEVARANANAYLEEMTEVDAVRDLDVTTKVMEGRPADAILSIAQSMQADLIVMSSHGHTGLKRWVLGSVAQVVERHSSIPVLLLRDQMGPSERLLHGMTKPIRVMVALDGTPLSEAILPVAAGVSAALSSPLPGALHLAMVVPEPLQGRGITTGTYTKAIQDAQSYLNCLSKRLRRDPQVGSNVEITSSISLQSKVSETLVKLAEIGADMEGVSTFTGYDLIAMATHGREGIDRWLHASITEQVLDATKVPVLVIRPAQAETGMAYDTNNDQQGSFAVGT
jgi:nucleotide-binding universal stress UspA family protein